MRSQGKNKYFSIDSLINSTINTLYGWRKSTANAITNAVISTVKLTKIAKGGIQSIGAVKKIFAPDVAINMDDMKNLTKNILQMHYFSSKYEIVSLLRKLSDSTCILPSIMKDLEILTNDATQLVTDIQVKQTNIIETLKNIINSKYSLARISAEFFSFYNSRKKEILIDNNYYSRIKHSFSRYYHAVYCVLLILKKYYSMFIIHFIRNENPMLLTTAFVTATLLVLCLASVINPIAIIPILSISTMIVLGYFIYKSYCYVLKCLEMNTIVTELYDRLFFLERIPGSTVQQENESTLAACMIEQSTRQDDLDLIQSMYECYQSQPGQTSYSASLNEARASIIKFKMSKNYGSVMLQKLSGVRYQNLCYQKQFARSLIKTLESKIDLSASQDMLLKKLRKAASSFGYEFINSYDNITKDMEEMNKILIICESHKSDIKNILPNTKQYRQFKRSFSQISEIDKIIARLHAQKVPVSLIELNLEHKNQPLCNELMMFIKTISASDLTKIEKSNAGKVHNKIMQMLSYTPQTTSTVLAAAYKFVQYWSENREGSVPNQLIDNGLKSIFKKYEQLKKQELIAKDLQLDMLLDRVKKYDHQDTSMWQGLLIKHANYKSIYDNIKSLQLLIRTISESNDVIDIYHAEEIYTKLNSLHDEIKKMSVTAKKDPIIYHYNEVCEAILNKSSFWQKNIFWKEKNLWLFQNEDSTSISITAALQLLSSLEVDGTNEDNSLKKHIDRCKTQATNIYNQLLRLYSKMNDDDLLITYEKICCEIERLSWFVRKISSDNPSIQNQCAVIINAFSRLRVNWEKIISETSLNQQQKILLNSSRVIQTEFQDFIASLNITDDDDTIGFNIYRDDLQDHQGNEGSKSYLDRLENIFDHIVIATKYGHSIEAILTQVMLDAQEKSKKNIIYTSFLNDLLYIPMSSHQEQITFYDMEAVDDRVGFADSFVETIQDDIPEPITKVASHDQPIASLSLWSIASNTMSAAAGCLSQASDLILAIHNRPIDCVTYALHRIDNGVSSIHDQLHAVEHVVSDSEMVLGQISYTKSKTLLDNIKNTIEDSQAISGFIDYATDYLSSEIEVAQVAFDTYSKKLSNWLGDNTVFLEKNITDYSVIYDEYYTHYIQRSIIGRVDNLHLSIRIALVTITGIATCGIFPIAWFFIRRKNINKIKLKAHDKSTRLIEIHKSCSSDIEKIIYSKQRIIRLYETIKTDSAQIFKHIKNSVGNKDILTLMNLLSDPNQLKTILIENPEEAMAIIKNALLDLNTLTNTISSPLTTLLPNIIQCLKEANSMHSHIYHIEKTVFNSKLSVSDLIIINTTESKNRMTLPLESDSIVVDVVNRCHAKSEVINDEQPIYISGSVRTHKAD